MLGGGHINADMQQFLEKDKKAGTTGWKLCWPHKLDRWLDTYVYMTYVYIRRGVYVYMCIIQYIILYIYMHWHIHIDTYTRINRTSPNSWFPWLPTPISSRNSAVDACQVLRFYAVLDDVWASRWALDPPKIEQVGRGWIHHWILTGPFLCLSDYCPLFWKDLPFLILFRGVIFTWLRIYP